MPAKKPAAKKAPVKKEAPKKEAPKKATEKKPAKKAEVKKPAAKTYHVAKRPDGKWQVKLAGGQVAIKLFDTQAQAIEYADSLAENQDGSVRVHSLKGKIRKA